MATVDKSHRVDDMSAIEGAVCAFGVFDGFHLGHQEILQHVLSYARQRGTKSAVITFDRDPDEIFGKDFRKIMSNEARINALLHSGADDVVVLTFTREFASQGPDEFAKHILSSAPLAILIGSGFHYGRGRSGDADHFRKWGIANGIEVVELPLLKASGIDVSSTAVRAYLAAGDINSATRFLGHPYTLSGNVVVGAQRGRKLGFATANLYIPHNLCVLKDGVYGAYAYVDGVRYRSAVSLGAAPTFDDARNFNLEAHILDFSGNIYGRELTVEPLVFIRPIMKFNDVDALVDTVNANIAWIRENIPL